MQNFYTQLEISRELVQEEIFDYLSKNRDRLLLRKPPANLSGSIWSPENGIKPGIGLDDLIGGIYQQLLLSKKLNVTQIPVAFNDSLTSSANTYYYQARINLMILEEVNFLIHLGVLLPVFMEMQGSNLGGVHFHLGDWLILTEYGAEFINNQLFTPYHIEPYLKQLAQVMEPDDELKGYLTEGLACLRATFARAAAILLRLAVEYLLSQLITSTFSILKDEAKIAAFKSKIRNAGIKIEERADVTFDRLESDSSLVPPQVKKSLSNQLKPAFHSIRELGGQAAHASATIQLERVRDQYILFVGSVYEPVMQIITYHQSLKSSSTTATET